MTGLSEKIRSINFVGMSMLLHSSAIMAIALGPHYFPEMMGNHTEPDQDTIEFTVLENSTTAQTVAMVETKPAPAPAPAPIVETKPAEVKVAEEKPSKSNEMPAKDAVIATKAEEKVEPVQEAKEEIAKEEFKEVKHEETAEALTDDSEILAQQKLEEEKERQAEQLRQQEQHQALEEKLAAVEAARAAEQAEIEELRQEQEKLAQEKAEAQALAAQAEAARVQQEQQAEQAMAEQKAAAEEAAQAAAAQQAAAEAAAAEKVAAAEQAAKKAAAEAKKGQGAGAGEKILVDQDFLSLRQKAGNIPPTYTTNMRLKKLEGRGQLVYFVNKQGAVSKMRLTKSTGSVELDNSAVDAFRKYKFVPGQQGYTVHNFEFRLKGPAKAHDGRLRARN